ncbi:MAG: metallophosphoesterase [Planctomycetes bacterium]|nr:metallophosphoesterase [Planctomycetota bacterium]
MTTQDADDELRDEPITPADEERTATRRRHNRRQVLVGALLLATLGITLQLVGPCLVPISVREGPLVQQPSESGATVVWYMSHDVPAMFQYVADDGSEVEATVESSERRRMVRLSGLSAGREYSYVIHDLNKKVLATGTLQTNRPAGTEFSFVLFGDSGEATPDQYLLGEEMANLRPDFAVHTGDLVYPDGRRDRYRERFFLPYAKLISRVAFWPCLGNHDVKDGYQDQAYREVFELPSNGPAGLPAEDNYCFDYGNARFVIIDSNLDEARLAESVAPWLERVLTESAARWKFVVYHHPAYTAGKYEPTPSIQNTLVPIMERAGVDVAFSGHDHMYERTHPLRGGAITTGGQGVVYVVSGAGGAALYNPKNPDQMPDWLAVRKNNTHSFSHVVISGGALRFRQIGANNQVLDEWALQKPQQTP